MIFTDMYKRIFAWRINHANDRLDPQIVVFKKKYLSKVQGETLEVGIGSGGNIKHYPKNISLFGIDTNIHVFPYTTRSAQKARLKKIRLKNADVEALPFDSSSFDTVVGTYILCSVAGQKKALQEIFRVLKPGGSYIFLEHIGEKKGSGNQRLQLALRQIWFIISDGCDLCSRVDQELINVSGHKVQMERFMVDNFLIRSHIVGVVKKKI